MVGVVVVVVVGAGVGLGVGLGVGVEVGAGVGVGGVGVGGVVAVVVVVAEGAGKVADTRVAFVGDAAPGPVPVPPECVDPTPADVSAPLLPPEAVPVVVPAGAFACPAGAVNPCW